MEKTRSRDTGGFGEKICEPCDDCYNLVSDAANLHRHNLAALESLLQQVSHCDLFMLCDVEIKIIVWSGSKAISE